jgi:hypothetical protein
MTIPARLEESGGWVTGVTHHQSPNYSPGGMNVPGGINGVVMHTMVGNLPGTDSIFMESSYEASAHFGIAQDGEIIQWVSITGGEAWAEETGNPNWYSIEHADDGDPGNALTSEQVNSSAQLVELLSRVGNFPLVVSNSVSTEGYGVHYMGGDAWGGHSCPQNLDGSGPRAGQRAAILATATLIRNGAPPSPLPFKSGDEGPNIVKLEQLLNTWRPTLTSGNPPVGGFPVLKVDGLFGPLVRDGVIIAQEYFGQRGVTAGTVNMALWEKLHEAP